MGDDLSIASDMALPKPFLLKLAIWTGSLGLGAYFVRRLVMRRQRIDAGYVSDTWLESRRAVADDLPYY